MGPRPSTNTCDEDVSAPSLCLVYRSGFRVRLQHQGGGLGLTHPPPIQQCAPLRCYHSSGPPSNTEQRPGKACGQVLTTYTPRGLWVPPSLTAHLLPITSARHQGTFPFPCLSPESIQEKGAQRKRGHGVCLLWGLQRAAREEAGLRQPLPSSAPTCPCQLSTLPD